MCLHMNENIKCSCPELTIFHVKIRNYEKEIKSLWVWTTQTMQIKIIKNIFTHAYLRKRKQYNLMQRRT